MRITSISRPPRKRRYEVRIDHAAVVPLSAEVIALNNLRAGKEISPERLAALQDQEARQNALATGLRLLAHGPRSEREMLTALRRRSVKPDVAAQTVARLRELRLLDDGALARSYVESRDRSSPRSRRLLAAELAAKGVARRDLAGAVAAVDEADAAYRAAVRRARALAGRPFAEFQRKLGDHLLRRGFGYEVAREAVRRVWKETQAAGRGEDDE